MEKAMRNLMNTTREKKTMVISSTQDRFSSWFQLCTFSDSNDEYEKDFVDDSKLNDTSSYRSESTLGSGSSDTDDDEHDNNDESETCNEEETDETSDDEETEEQTKKSPIEDEE